MLFANLILLILMLVIGVDVGAFVEIDVDVDTGVQCHACLPQTFWLAFVVH